MLPLLFEQPFLRITQLFYELSLSMGRQKYKLFLICKAFFKKNLFSLSALQNTGNQII